MVTNTTIYTRQLYVSLSSDTPDVDFHNGDEVYLIDTRQRVIYDEENSTWYPLPTGGGGGGVTVNSLSVTENGTYTAPSGTAYSPVTVAVPTQADNWISSVGTITVASAGTSVILPTGVNNATLVSVSMFITGDSADWPTPSIYSKTYCSAGMEYFNKVAFGNRGGLSTMPMYNENKAFDYWSNQIVTIAANGDITVSTNKSDTIFPAGLTYKWVAVLEV